MAGKRATPVKDASKNKPKTTPVKKSTMKAPRDGASAPNSPTGRGTPRRATANKATERMKEMAVKTEDMDEDDAFDGDDDYAAAPSAPASGRTTPKKYRARVLGGSGPPTPMSKRCVNSGSFILSPLRA